MICTNEEYLNDIYKKAGKPGKPVMREKIHWIPYKTKYDSGRI